MTSLRELPIGKTATIRSVGGEGALRQHFLDMGLIPKGEVTMVKYAPMGDPMELRIHSYELTLRLADAEKIEIENIRDAVSVPDSRALHKNNTARTIPHPGLGEGGKYHKKETEHPLPDNEILTFALAGNQNCGKTTLFNQLTGSSQHVGNFPGVTVDRKDGNIRGKSNTLVTDLGKLKILMAMLLLLRILFQFQHVLIKVRHKQPILNDTIFFKFGFGMKLCNFS